MNYDKALATLTQWAQNDDNVRCIVLTGSAAAGNAHPLSDRDLELHVRDTKPLEKQDSWWERLGDVIVVERLENDKDQPTRLVYYVGGKLDFTLINTSEDRGTYRRPYKILLDKDSDADKFTIVKSAFSRPDQQSFDECMNWGYAAAIMLAKAIVRDEPWSIKVRDNDLKTELLRAIEWDHVVRYGDNLAMRHRGTRMRQWMDSDIQLRLQACWASFDVLDSRRALLATLALFNDEATRITNLMQLTDFNHQRVQAEIQAILDSKS